MSERDLLPDHSSSKEDTEGKDEDSGNLIEAMSPLAPQDLRPGDKQSVDDELALRGPRDEQEEADRCNQTSPEDVHVFPTSNQRIGIRKGNEVWRLGIRTCCGSLARRTSRDKAPPQTVKWKKS